MTGEKKDRRSLFEISNSAFVESLSSNTSFLDSKHIPKKIASSIVGKILDNYHERLSDDPICDEPQSVRARQNLDRLGNISLEEFSTQKYSQIDQDIVMKTLSRQTNCFKSLDLTNVKVSDLPPDITFPMRFPGSEGSDSSGSTSGYPGILDMLQSAFDDDSDNDDSDVEMEQCPHRVSSNSGGAAASGASGTPFGDNNLVHQNSQNSTNSKKERKVSRLQRRFHRHNIYSEQIKTDQLKCLSLPRLLTEERVSGNRIEAVNRFVRNNFDFSSDHTAESPYSFIRLSFDLAPNLLSLSIGSCSCIRLDQWNPPMLTHLNLSHLNSHNFPPEILAVRYFPISVLEKTLKSLTLYQSEFEKTFLLEEIYKCKNLEFLDISMTPKLHNNADTDSSLTRPKTEEKFEIWDIIDNLPKLHSLDASGTTTGSNLKANKLITCSGESGRLRIDLPHESIGNLQPEIPSWLRRLPLSYLGLWGCDINFESMELLSNEIAGNRDAKQMLISAQRWRNEPVMAAQIWNAIFDFVKNSELRNDQTSIFLEECILTFNKYYRDEHAKLPLILSANMFYLVNPEPPGDTDEETMELVLKQNSLKCLIRCINFNLGANRVIRNILLTMSKFRLPDDLLFIYEVSAQTMLKVLLRYHITPQGIRHEDAEFLTNMVIQFANQFVCQVDLNLKLATRRIKFIDTICSVIQNRLDNNNEPDDPLKGCWSCLWNVTDETPSNSERFIENGGVELFLNCLKKFPNDTDLKRNIMGLVGNIAEVASLRQYLIRDETVRFYSDALQSEGLEVAYNACGTLSHILSDESSTWPESLLEMKKDMTQKMIQAVESWDESAERNINYRSLKPIIYLLRCHHCIEAQTWATWALASLTHKEESNGKYIQLTIEEGGFVALEELVSRNKASSFIIQKAKKVLERVQKVQNKNKECTCGGGGAVAGGDSVL